MFKAVDQFHDILYKYWRYSTFRPLQEEIIHSIAEGNDTLGLMPTGGGKSIIFQVFALSKEGLCIVVTPLIALMKDQVDNLVKLGIKASAIYSGMSRDEIISRLENCIFGDYKFLYISPERLSTDFFQQKLAAMNVCLLVVDESHCISQWGYDFRPSYLHIAEVRKMLPQVPILALTATATPDVVDDIQAKLLFSKSNVFRKSFIRKNLAYIVRPTEQKLDMLLHILNRVPGSAIIYVRSRQRAKDYAEALHKVGISAEYFHAGLFREEKELRQNKWKSGEIRVMVATNAFGMGIDKPDVRMVIHIDMPSSLEEYFQEAGRAGRDGLKSYSVVLFSKHDIATLKKRLSEEFPQKKFIHSVYDSLGNYFQIAVGFGMGTIHDFSLADFCSTYHFPQIETHYALKILELSGYIEYTEEQESNSRLIFVAKRDELYSILKNNTAEDILISTLLRLYSGLFSDYVFINENYLASKCNITTDEVYNILINLSKIHIIHYIPKKSTPFILYSQTREDLKYLKISKVAYEDRKERLQKRISDVVNYLQNNTICRSRILISNFGEKNTNDCGTCDVCLRRKESELKDVEYNAIRENLITLLLDGPKDINIVVNALPYNEEKSLNAIKFIVEHDKSFNLNLGQLFYYNMNE